MKRFTPRFSEETPLSSIISDELAQDFPIKARKLPIKKRFKHSSYLANNGLRTVSDLQKFVEKNHFDINEYASTESAREIYAILLALYPAESLGYSLFAQIKYCEQNNLCLPRKAHHLLYNDLWAKISSEDFEMKQYYEVEDAMKRLDALERDIIELRYGFGEHRFPLTAKEIAKYYRIDNETVSASEVQFIINDCLDIMRAPLRRNAENKKASKIKAYPSSNLLLKRRIADLEKDNAELSSQNEKLQEQVQKLTTRSDKLAVDLAASQRKVSPLEQESKTLKKKIQALETQHEAESIQLAYANHVVEYSKRTIAELTHKYTLLRQLGPIRYEIHWITREAIWNEAQNKPAGIQHYVKNLHISGLAQEYLRNNQCITREQIVALIASDGWDLMYSNRYRCILIEIMRAIHFNPVVTQENLDELGLSTRSYNALTRNGYHTTEDVKNAAITGKLYDTRCLGRKSLDEVLEKIGLKR